MTITFKELLDKYQNGTATPEERQQVEEQIETFNLLQEFTLTHDDSINWDPSILPNIDTKKMSHQVNRKLWKFVSSIVALVIGLGIFFQFILSPMLDHVYFNPTTLAPGAPLPTYSLVSSVYTELTQPGISLNQITTERTGIGSYQLTNYYDMELTQSETALPLAYTMKRNELAVSSTALFTGQLRPIWKGDSTKEADEINDTFKQQTLNNIESLPKSSELGVSLSFAKPLSISETLALFDTTDLPSGSNYRVQWFSMDSPSLNLGFNWFGTFPILGEHLGQDNAYLLKLNKQYPYLFPGAPSSQNISSMADALESHALSLMSFSLDHAHEMEIQPVAVSINDIESLFNQAKKEGITIKGVYLSGTPAAISQFGSKKEVSHIDVQHTSLYSNLYQD